MSAPDWSMPPVWMDDARCTETDPEAFFPAKGASIRAVKRVCDTCKVEAACLLYALDHDERFGVWGGKSERERRVLKKRRREVAS